MGNDELPFCVNFKKCEAYLLPPDEMVLFEWLLFKQNSFGVGNSFYYTRKRIESDTKINRRRQDAIFAKFEGMGFLKRELQIKSGKNSATYHFRIEYEILKNDNVLSQILDIETFVYIDMQRYLEKCAPF